MKPLLVTASTLLELSLLIEATSAVPVPGVGHVQLFRGAIGGRELLLAVTGIGKVNAASSVTLLLERFTPALLINTGCGGAYPGAPLAVGDLAIAESECFADEGVQTPQGWRGLDLIGIPVCHSGDEAIFNRIPISPAPAAAALRFAADRGIAVNAGHFLTVSTCSGTSSHGDELLRRFPGICENMEGAAVAQVALIYGVPLLEVRGISNMVEDRDLSRWDLETAVTRVQQFVAAYVKVSSFEFGVSS
jgi:futalosine hydrolase